MIQLIRRYTHWLHTQWPAGQVEPLPVVDEQFRSTVPGVFIVGDLTGIPLLKFALDSGARAVGTLAAEHEFLAESRKKPGGTVDVAIIGGGVSGYAAAVECKQRSLSFVVIESARPLSTLFNFPIAKPIYTYPHEMIPEGALQVSADLKESLIEELEEQIAREEITTLEGRVETIQKTGSVFRLQLEGQDESIHASRVVVAIGRSGDYRTLGVPGEQLDKVTNRLYDPKDFAGLDVLVVGGGDSAVETAAVLAECGARVTLSYRKPELSRPKSENIDRFASLLVDPIAQLTAVMPSVVKQIRETEAVLVDGEGNSRAIPNNAVFTMIGREPPLDFFRRNQMRIAGEWTAAGLIGGGLFLLFCIGMYLWKASGNPLSTLFVERQWFPFNLGSTLSGADRTSIIGVIALSMMTPAFYYGLLYSLVVTGFGIRRIRRRRTPYITAQTWTLIAIQVIPLFILPSILFPWMGHNGWLPAWFENAFFPVADYDPHGREYWRASGFILAWPLFIYNVFTNQPLWAWLAVSFVQTFVLIPWMIYYWGKGVYCGWICSCGALAETLGDDHRTKMPHGPFWNRLNMAGQAILAFAFVILALRVLSWMGAPIVGGVSWTLQEPIYKYAIDVTLSSILGVGLYFWYSGRVWCRFFCPLAALMHIYARFSRFRILAEKKKCISCNVCTTVCHQGIDVMSFANKGAPMNDPECVRCSACVYSCPTGVLSFGQVDRTGEVIHRDTTGASPVRMREG